MTSWRLNSSKVRLGYGLTEAATIDVLLKKLFQQILQHSQENCVGVSFLILSLKVCSFIKRRLQHRYFPVNIPKILKTSILKNICKEAASGLTNLRIVHLGHKKRLRVSKFSILELYSKKNLLNNLLLDFFSRICQLLL